MTCVASDTVTSSTTAGAQAITVSDTIADPVGYAFWLNLLDHGTPRIALTATLASSAEYRRRVIGGTSTVLGLYQQYLGRPADPVGMVFWLGLMASGGSFEQVRLGLLGSSVSGSRSTRPRPAARR